VRAYFDFIFYVSTNPQPLTPPIPPTSLTPPTPTQPTASSALTLPTAADLRASNSSLLSVSSYNSSPNPHKQQSPLTTPSS